MDSTEDIPLRTARDRIIDLLGVGECYPLTDLNLINDQLKVPYGDVATIQIENAQIGVIYQLYGPDNKVLSDEFQGLGNGGALEIKTPQVMEDITYHIHALKKPQNPHYTENLSVFLDTPAKIKVGIETQLVVQLLDIPLLEPNLSNPQASDPRIISYQGVARVQIDKTQEGVDYVLLVDGNLQSDHESGNLKSIILSTDPVSEDCIIQVQATKTFPAAQKRKPDVEVLDTTLYLKVLANPNLVVAAAPTSIVAYKQASKIRVEKPQATASYKAYHYRIKDDDFIRDTTTTDVVAVSVPGKPDIHVAKPLLKERWYQPDGFVALEEEKSGNGTLALEFTLEGMTDDSLVIIEAIKHHQVTKDKPQTIESSVCLNSITTVLVGPNPNPPLKLELQTTSGQEKNRLQVSGGQAGVFYYFRPDTGETEFPLPVYFHKRDLMDESQNKGLGQLAIEIDYVLTADMLDGYPPMPSLDNVPFSVADKLAVRMMKAETGVEANMGGSVTIEDGAGTNV